MRRKKSVRYGVPVVVAGVIALGAGLPALSSASVPSGLAPTSVKQVLTDVFSAKAPQLSGSLTWTANLGLSGLSSLQQQFGSSSSSAAPGSGSGSSDNSAAGFNPLSLLGGTFNIDVWLDGNHAQHLALIEPPTSEVDLVRNGDQAWLWDSQANSVEHLIGSSSGDSALPTSTTTDVPQTPDQLAQRLLDKSAATTTLSLGQPLYVAGQAAYQLLAVPTNASGSTVDHIEVDVAAQGPLQGVVLQVAVYATGQVAPALELGFTGSITVGAPPASELTFTPPPGATVTTHTLPAGPLLGHKGTAQPEPATTAGRPSVSGKGWDAVVEGTSAHTVASLQQGGPESDLFTRVSVGGQSGWLLTTSLLNVLLLPDGHYYAGLVKPAVLEQAALNG